MEGEEGEAEIVDDGRVVRLGFLGSRLRTQEDGVLRGIRKWRDGMDVSNGRYTSTGSLLMIMPPETIRGARYHTQVLHTVDAHVHDPCREAHWGLPSLQDACVQYYHKE